MNSVSAVLGESYADHPLKTTFLKWQCLVRQIMMRESGGRPDDSIMPAVFLPGSDEPMGCVITIMNKTPAASILPELRHMAKKNMDPMQRRNQALQFFSSSYYQKHKEFSDILTATFPPGSPGAAKIRDAERCTLVFESYGQRFDLDCKVWRLAAHNPLNEATLAHNRLFNPEIPDETEVLGFEPDWDKSKADH